MARLVLSMNERLLVHLLEMDRHKDDADVPPGASQDGIAKRLNIGVHTVSRALSSVTDEGLVSERLSHVRGAPKRRKVYFLTEAGLKAAQALKADLLSRRVVLEHEGRAQEMSLEDAIKRIASITGSTPGLLELVDIASAGDVIRTEAIPRPASTKKCGLEFVERSQGRPRVESFYGREAEKKSLLDQLDGEGISVVLIWGIPGIGKSTLASKLFDELSGKRTMQWFSFREWDTESSFLSSLSEFLVAAGRDATSSALSRGSSPAEMFLPLVDDLSACRAVIFLDDIQKCSRRVMPQISMLTEAARASGSGKVVLISRSVPAFFSTTAAGNVAFELKGLDRDSAWRMAQSMRAKDAVHVVDESGGHPLLLSLMVRGGPGQARGDISSFIEREIYSAVSDEERRTLEMLSIFRHPVPMDALPDVDYRVVAGLRSRSLVVEQEDGIWVHDLLREFFASHLSAQLKRQYHALAAAYCDKKPLAEWKLEALYHLVEQEEWTRARRVALANANDLAENFPEETLAFVSKIPVDSGSHPENAQLLFMRGQLHEEIGKDESALADFEQSLSLLEAESDVTKRALVLEAQARLRSEVRRWSEALSDHEKALHIYEKSKDVGGQIREWMNIGGVLRRKGDLGKARAAYTTALSLSTKSEDRPSEAASLNNLGLLDRDEGRLGDAEAKLRESVRLAHAVKDNAGEARGLENLAELMRAKSRLDEVIGLLRESSEAFKRSGEVEEYKRLRAVCAEALGEQGKPAEGIEMAEAALVDPELRRRPGLFQKATRFDRGDLALSETIVNLLRSSHDIKKAQKELVRFEEIATSLGEKEGVARGRLLQAIVYEEAGNLDAAASQMDQAEQILKSIGGSEGLVAVHMRRAALEVSRGDMAAAARHYAEAAKQAERVGNVYARTAALERLDSLT